MHYLHAFFISIFTGSLFRDEIKRISKEVRKWIKIEKLIYFEVNGEKKKQYHKYSIVFQYYARFFRKQNLLLEYAFI